MRWWYLLIMMLWHCSYLMPVYRKTGRSLMEMNIGKHWRMWSRYPEMSIDLLGMANYTWWCSAQSVVIRWFRLPRQSGYWLQREPGDSLYNKGRGWSSSQFLIIMRHHWWMRMICDTIRVMQKMEVSRSTKLDSWLVGSWKEGINYEETLAPMARYT